VIKIKEARYSSILFQELQEHYILELEMLEMVIPSIRGNLGRPF
jgi:hypothetical protein